MIVDNIQGREIELLQGAYIEAQRMKDLAWGHVQREMLAQSPLLVGDRFATEFKYAISGSKHDRFMGMEKSPTLYEVTRMFVSYDDLYGWRTQAKAYPVKKDGTVAVKGEFTVSDVQKAFAADQFKVLTDDAN